MFSWKNIITLISLFLIVKGYGQQIIFKHYSVGDGLPSSMVRSIDQDEQGYMWFGTKNGLSRFDGYQFKNFQFRKGQEGTIGNNFIHCVTHFDSTHLWIGTDDGLYVLDLEKEVFSAIPGLEGRSVYELQKGEDGKIWLTSRLGGLSYYDPATKKLNSLNKGKDGSAISSLQVTKLAKDEEGNIWVGTVGSGIEIFDIKTRTFRHLTTANSGLSNDNVITLYKGLDGSMWIGTMNGGLCRYDKKTGAFTTYKSGGAFTLKDDIVRAVCQTSPDKLYVGTEKGLNILDLATGKIVAYTNESYDPYSISDNAVYSIFPDKVGTLWVGTWFGGVNYFPEKGSAFEYYYPTGEPNSLSGRAVSCFLEEEPGKFWIGTEDGGLNYFDEEKQSFSHYPFARGQQKLSYHNIHSLIKDRKGNIWIGIFAGGVNVLNPATGRVQSYMQQGIGDHTLSGNLVFSLFEDQDGVIWAGTDRSLNWFDEGSGSFKRLDYPEITNTFIYDIKQDANKTYWIACYDKGLLSWNRKTGEWHHITADDRTNPLSSNKLTSLHLDNKGNLWIGTDGGGLNRYDMRSGQVKIYDEKTGINGNIVYAIADDDRSVIWITTNNGIYSIDAQTDKITHFTSQDNLQGQQFNYKALYKASDGKLYAGGIKGFNSFYPDQTEVINNTAVISFTNFQLFNRNVSPSDEKSPLLRQINFTDKLKLAHDQSVMSFEFAALNVNAPEKIRYAYKMEGFDPDWNYVGEQRKATYTNLSPGTYTFRVKASTDESNWDVQEKRILLVIRPPFYKTTTAYLIYALLLLVLAWGAYHYASNYIRRQNEMKVERLKNKEEQEFYARKIEFFTVMAHEIRTPLSLIIAPLEKLISLNKWDKEEKEQMQIMDENAERLMDLVNQLLDFRRIESDAYEIKKEEVEIVSLVQSIYSRFSSLSYQKNTEFTLSTKISSLPLQADPEVLNKILSNLLINAFKFARKNVKLTIDEPVKTESGENLVRISVEDDGIGIPGTDIKNIFKKFFTASKEGHQYHNLGGTGIGLALSSSLAEKHGGNLLVESKEGSHTVFTLEIPYGATERSVPVTQAESVKELPADSGHAVVLIVEDDESIQSFLAKSLSQEGYMVRKASDGKEALQVMSDHPVDLVISDVMMPVMDGFELSRAIKSDIDYSHIPLILLTARGNTEAEIEGIETGADAYITKPFKWKHLAAVVKNLIESREKLKTRFSEHPHSDVSVLTTNSRDKEFMENVVHIIQQRIIDPTLSVEELSREMAMSRSSLHKKLKSLSGYGPNELIRLVRLKQAAKYLVAGENTIAEIAYLTGFSSPSYFSKCFQQQFRLTPKEYADQKSDQGREPFGEYVKNEIT